MKPKRKTAREVLVWVQAIADDLRAAGRFNGALARTSAKAQGHVIAGRHLRKAAKEARMARDWLRRSLPAHRTGMMMKAKMAKAKK